MVLLLHACIMGILDLYPFIKKHASSAIFNCQLNVLTNQRIGIDFNAFLYTRMFSLLKDNSEELLDDEVQMEIMIIKEIEKFVQNLQFYGIVPIFVIDGPPPKEKLAVADRKDRREKTRLEIKELEENITYVDSALAQQIDENDKQNEQQEKQNEENEKHEDNNIKISAEQEEEYIRIFLYCKRRILYLRQQTSSLPAYIIDAAMNKLMEDGLHVWKADTEADTLLIGLAHQNIISYIATEDGDIIAGIPRHCSTVRQMFLNPNINQYITVYNKDLILKNLNVSYEQFIDMCILFGCDYLKRIPKCGPETIYKNLPKYETTELFLRDKIFPTVKGWTLDQKEDYIKKITDYHFQFFHFDPATVEVNQIQYQKIKETFS